jgi:hypothetical protein
MPTRPGIHRPSGAKSREESERARKAALDARRPQAHERGYDWAWRRCRKLFVAKHPTCCVAGCGAPTQEVDHIQSVAERPDLRLSWSNLRPLCLRHHSQRTALEQGFARRGEDHHSRRGTL